MEPNYQDLYHLADQVMVYAEQRGHYYALEMWSSLYDNWCILYNDGSVVIPEAVKENLKRRHMMFCDYFSE